MFFLLLLIVPLLLAVYFFGWGGWVVTQPDGAPPPAVTEEVVQAPQEEQAEEEQDNGSENPPFQPAEDLPGTGQGQPDLEVGGSALSELFKIVSPGVVSIQVTVTQGGQTGQGAGSGFIIDEQGYIATNYHVIAGASTVYVSFYNGIIAEAEVIGSDDDSDLAILRVEELPEGTVALPLGDSDQVEVGDWVVAIGNPFNIGSSMSLGIVSAVGRVIPAPTGITAGAPTFSIPKAIQTDAAINPGNSGGPLLSIDGRVIGVNAQIQTTTGVFSGIGFAIPANILRNVAPELIANGEYQWPWLGVTGTDVVPDIVKANNLDVRQGAYIFSVVPGSPADEAGLQGASQQSGGGDLLVPTGGDVVVEADGETIESYDELLTIIAFKRPGETLNLVILRNGERLEIPVILAERPQGSLDSSPLFP